MTELTSKQRLILHFIARSTAVKGFPPTFSEVAEEFGIKSSTAFTHINQLIRKGFLVKDPGTARSLRLADQQIQYEIAPSPKTKSLYLWRVQDLTATAIARFMSDKEARQFAEDCAAALRITYSKEATQRILLEGESMEASND